VESSAREIEYLLMGALNFLDSFQNIRPKYIKLDGHLHLYILILLDYFAYVYIYKKSLNTIFQMFWFNFKCMLTGTSTDHQSVYYCSEVT